MRSSDPGFGIYVHWPFCKAKCPYCDFNSHVRHAPVDAMSFADALVRELQWFAGQTEARTVTSVFFGGGTPSLMPPAAVGRVLNAVAALWPVAADCEITLEANPTSIEAENFRSYRAAGVNRASVGVQALNDADLKALGRQHTVAEALAAFDLAARTFPRVSFDLIYARPGQTATDWHAELTRALTYQQGHMSLYQLTIEPGTMFEQLWFQGKLATPDEDTGASLYEITQNLTEAAGLPAYEISNHARPGAESRHNLTYWRYGEYAGVGPGAHSRIGAGPGRRAIAMEKHPETWRGLVQARGHGAVEDALVSLPEQASEYLLMGMRTREGIDLERFAGIASDRIEALAQLGFVEQDGKWLRATRRGRPLLNALIAELSLCRREREGPIAQQWEGEGLGAQLFASRGPSPSPEGRGGLLAR